MSTILFADLHDLDYLLQTLLVIMETIIKSKQKRPSAIHNLRYLNQTISTSGTTK